MNFTKSFKEIDKSDAPIAGGKGASLGEMTQAGIAVPPGFVVLASTFERFLEEADLLQEIDTVLHSVNKEEMHTVESASEKIKVLILNAEISKDIAGEIKKEFKKLGVKYVAVRSSATAEDGADHAWAGQLDSFLNTTEENLLFNVKKCWASLFTPRAIFYRYEKDLHKQKISVAVVVQKMVESEYSGIAFSVHPVTEDHNQLIIEAGFGLGESIVSGSVTPDSYVVEKVPRRIIDINVNTQTRGLIRANGGIGNKWEDIPEPKASSRVMTEEQILELAEIILRIENHYGFPCDIEWAYEKGKFYITQSRPITTLIGEKTLVQKFLSLLGNEKIIIFEADFYPLLVFLDWLNYYDRDGSMKNIYPFFCFKKGHSTKAYVSLSKYHNVPKLVFQMYLDGKLDIDDVNKKYKVLGKEIDNFYERYYKIETRNEQELLSELSEVYQDLQKLVTLTLFLDTLDQQAIEEVLRERNINVNLSKIWGVSRVLDFVSFDSKNAKEIINIIKENKKVERLQHIFTNYTYVPSAEDIKEKLGLFRIDEEVQKLEKNLEEIKKNVKIKEEEQKSLSAEEKLILRFIDWSSWLRDDRKTLINKADVLFFNLTSKLYNKWGLEQSLVPVSFVFEVLKGGDFNKSIADKIEKRKDKMVLIYYGDDKYEEDTTQPENEIKILNERFLLQNKPQNESVIKGEIASLGFTKGKVRIILKRSEFNDFKEGEILVTGMTRPEFVPLMKKAAAIITDEGGITSHAAIVSRELKKPCIIGTRVATKVLHNGDLVEVDADKGVVRILKRTVENMTNNLDNKNEKLIKLTADLSKWGFEFKQRNSQPVLASDLWLRGMSKYFHSVFEMEIKIGYLFASDDRGYINKKQKILILNELKKRTQNPKYVRQVVTETMKAIEDFHLWAESVLTNHNLENIKKDELNEIWHKHTEEFIKMIPWFWLPYYISGENILTDRVEALLKPYKKDIEEITDFNHALALLITSNKKGMFQKEQDFFARLVDGANQNKNFTKSQDFVKEASEYLKRFGFLKQFLILPIEPLTFDELVKRVDEAVFLKWLETWKVQQNKALEYKKVEEKILNIIKDDKIALTYVSLAKELGYVLTSSVEGALRATSLLGDLYKKIADTIGVPFNDWVLLRIDEISKILEGSLLPKDINWRDRKLGYLAVLQNATTEWFFGTDAKHAGEDIFKKLCKVNIGKVSKIVGKVGFKGKVKGNVKIIFGADNFNKFKNNEILVTGMTTPDYVPLIRNSSAIITDEGGLLCHAAIISRELGKPCIIGTKIATQVLKDGDLVEVDADKGVVRILKKKQ